MECPREIYAKKILMIFNEKSKTLRPTILEKKRELIRKILYFTEKSY